MRRLPPALAALLLPLCLLACQSVPAAHEAGDGSTEVASPEPAQAEVVERMLAVSVSGQTIMVLEARLEKGADGSRTERELATLSLVREGGGDDATFSSTTETVTIYDADKRLVSEVEIEREAGITITRTITIDGDELVSRYSGPGRPEQVKRFALPPEYRESLSVDLELIAAWEQSKQPVSRTYATFDSNRERFETITVTLHGATEYEFAGERIPAYSFRTVEEDGTVTDAIVDHDLMPLKVEAAGIFVASLVEQRPELGGDGTGRINSELPVSGETSNRWWELARQDVTVNVAGDNPDAPSLWESSHYHEVVREGERYRMTLRSTRPGVEFVAPTLPLKIDDPEVRRFLAPTDMAQSDNPQIIARAREIVGDERDALVAAAKIVEAVYADIDKQAGVRGSATATEVLQNGAGDCTEHAVLVVALMRAAGIPARTVDGIVMLAERDGSGVAGYHAWAEIWLGQWIGVDATVNETGTSARYFNFGVDEPGTRGSEGKMMRSLGKTTIELGPHELYEGR